MVIVDRLLAAGHVANFGPRVMFPAIRLPTYKVFVTAISRTVVQDLFDFVLLMIVNDDGRSRVLYAIRDCTLHIWLE